MTEFKGENPPKSLIRRLVTAIRLNPQTIKSPDRTGPENFITETSVPEQPYIMSDKEK